MRRTFIIALVALICANIAASVFLISGLERKRSAENTYAEKKQAYSAANERLKSEKNKLDSMRSEKSPRINAFDLSQSRAGIDMTAGISVCIDAGHGITDRKEKEPVSPSSSEKKAANVSGAAGEEPINLEISKKLKAILEQNGISVDMTREENKCDKSNIERAEQANGSDYSIRIHCDGSESSAQNGISVLVPEKSYFDDESFPQKSRALGEAVLKTVTASTGAKNNGISVRGDLTGFNWSRVPCILVECGFVSNSAEYEKLKSADYQQKIAQGIADGFLEFIKAQNQP